MATDQEHCECLQQLVLQARLLATTDENAPGTCKHRITGEVDLTVSKFDWRAMPKSLPAGAEMVGTGFAGLLSAS